MVLARVDLQGSMAQLVLASFVFSFQTLFLFWLEDLSLLVSTAGPGTHDEDTCQIEKGFDKGDGSLFFVLFFC